MLSAYTIFEIAGQLSNHLQHGGTAFLSSLPICAAVLFDIMLSAPRSQTPFLLSALKSYQPLLGTLSVHLSAFLCNTYIFHIHIHRVIGR